MEKVAKFEKVSYERFNQDLLKVYPDFTEEDVHEIYDGIKLPKRATVGSCGYDFYSPLSGDIYPEHDRLQEHDYVDIPTGIRCSIKEDWALLLFPRSGLGFKYGMRLINGTGVIDSDYYHAENEGHIHARITVDYVAHLDAGQAFMQGVFLPYGITEGDEADGVRTGGLGSTDKR